MAAVHLQLRLLCFTSPASYYTSSFSAPNFVSFPLYSSFALSSSLNSTSLSLQHNYNHSRGFSHLRPILCSSSTVVTEKPEVQLEEEEVSRTRLLGQNVPWTSTTDDIRALFEKHGKVIDVELSMHNKTRNRGLAFVEMGSPEEAAEAMNKLEGYEFEGRTLKLNYAKPKKSKPALPETKQIILHTLFVANLTYAARAKDLREFFSSGGNEVVSAEVIFEDNPRRSAGYGFISFATKEEADVVLSTFQGKEFMGRTIRVARGKKVVKAEIPGNSDSEDISGEVAPNTDQPAEP